jgi:hypothetical protein
VCPSRGLIGYGQTWSSRRFISGVTSSIMTLACLEKDGLKAFEIEDQNIGELEGFSTWYYIYSKKISTFVYAFLVL